MSFRLHRSTRWAQAVPRRRDQPRARLSQARAGAQLASSPTQWRTEHPWVMIRIRRVPQPLPIGRPYETEVRPRAAGERGWRRVSRSPVGLREPITGVGDAWSFVREANRQGERVKRAGRSSSTTAREVNAVRGRAVEQYVRVKVLVPGFAAYVLVVAFLFRGDAERRRTLRHVGLGTATTDCTPSGAYGPRHVVCSCRPAEAFA